MDGLDLTARLHVFTEFQIQAEIQEVSLALRESTKNLCRNLKDNPNISGNLLKIQRERTELMDILSTSCRQIGEVGFSFADHFISLEQM